MHNLEQQRNISHTEYTPASAGEKRELEMFRSRQNLEEVKAHVEHQFASVVDNPETSEDHAYIAYLRAVRDFIAVAEKVDHSTDKLSSVELAKEYAVVNGEIIDSVLAFEQDDIQCAALWNTLDGVWEEVGGDQGKMRALQSGVMGELAVKQSLDNYLDVRGFDSTVRFSNADEDVRKQTDYVVEDENGSVNIQLKLQNVGRQPEEAGEGSWVDFAKQDEKAHRIHVHYAGDITAIMNPVTGRPTKMLARMIGKGLTKHEKDGKNTFLEPMEVETGDTGSLSPSALALIQKSLQE